MNVDALYPVVESWYNTGLLPDSDKPAVLAAYTELTGLTFSGSCKKCQWSDVQHVVRFYLIKTLGLKGMDTSNKYQIKKSLAYLAIHGLAYVYINKGQGVESNSAKYLTDDIAAELLKKPGMDEAIELNPDYEAPKKAEKPPVDPAKQTPQQKAAATKKAKQEAEGAIKKAELEAVEAEAQRLAKEQADAQNPDTNPAG